MPSRREFIGNLTTFAGTVSVPASVLGANDRIRVGIIGPGARGMNLVEQAITCPNVDFVAFADIYTKRLEAALKVVPKAKTYLDYRYLLEDKSIDAVLIATPQHLHCECFVASMDTGKHVYQEKTMAFTVEHAKRMRAAYRRAGKRTVQIGHQDCSYGNVPDAIGFLESGNLGTISCIHSTEFRNTPHNRPQWSRPATPDMNPENIVWKAFQGEAAPHPFDPNRYINWRFYWDYSGGNFYENMCHQLAFWYKVMKLEIPESVVATGGVYVWKDGREVPDTMTVSMKHGDKLLFTWDSGFGNKRFGDSEDVLGTDGSISRNETGVRYLPERVNRPDGTEIEGRTPTDKLAHMRNFFDCIRSGKETNCPFELGFRVSIPCRMAVESYRQGRLVRWDKQKEEIV